MPGGINDWLTLFLKSMQKQKRHLEAKMSAELVATRIPRLSLQIIELIKGRGPSSVADVVAPTGANRNTVKVHVRNLVASGQLVPEGVERAVRYRRRL